MYFFLSPFQRETTYKKAKNFRREKSIQKIIREISTLKKITVLIILGTKMKVLIQLKKISLKNLQQSINQKLIYHL